MNPCLPGGTTSFDQPGVVHPQEACTFRILTGRGLLLMNTNSWVTGPLFSSTTPKSWVSSRKFNCFACWAMEEQKIRSNTRLARDRIIAKNIRVKLKNSLCICAYPTVNVGCFADTHSRRRCTGIFQATLNVCHRAGCYQQFIFFALWRVY